MPLSSQQKKQERLLAKRDADGYPGLIPLEEIYHFEDFLIVKRFSNDSANCLKK